MDQARRLTWSGESEQGDRFEVYLVMGAPSGILLIQLATGQAWQTEIGLDEIAMFASRRNDLLSLYMDEMAKNARAGQPRTLH